MNVMILKYCCRDDDEDDCEFSCEEKGEGKSIYF